MNGNQELKALIESLADQAREDAKANFSAFQAQAKAFKDQGSKLSARFQSLADQVESLADQVREDAKANFDAFRAQAQAFKGQGARLEAGFRELASQLAGTDGAVDELRAQVTALEQRVTALEAKDAAA